MNWNLMVRFHQIYRGEDFPASKLLLKVGNVPNGILVGGPPFQNPGYHYRILSNLDYCVASRLQWHDREAPPSAEGRPHVPCRCTLGRSSSVGPVGESQCMEGGLESFISLTGVRFSPAVTGGILRPLPL